MSLSDERKAEIRSSWERGGSAFSSHLPGECDECDEYRRLDDEEGEWVVVTTDLQTGEVTERPAPSPVRPEDYSPGVRL